MYLHLTRNHPHGKALTGQLFIDGKCFCDTLEHWQHAIPAGFYRLRLSYAPLFNEVLPLLSNVYGFACNPHSGAPRTGIRIHAGNTIDHTDGSILVGELSPLLLPHKGASGQRLLSSRQALDALREYLLTNQTLHPYEEVYIEITEPDNQ